MSSLCFPSDDDDDDEEEAAEEEEVDAKGLENLLENGSSCIALPLQNNMRASINATTSCLFCFFKRSILLRLSTRCCFKVEYLALSVLT
jgi:hypothetical protein